MTKLTQKLESLQCDCDSLNGKTIKQSRRERGYYWLLFTDGTWCVTNYEWDVDDLLEMVQDYDDEDNPFVDFGLATADEIEEHWREVDEWKKRIEEQSARWDYEKLRKRFDGKK